MPFHNFAFLFLLSTLSIRLAPHSFIGSFLFILYLIFTLWIYFGKPTPFKSAAGWLLPPLSVPLLYFSLNPVMSLLAPPTYDSQLQKIDIFLVGGNLSQFLRPWAHPLLTEVMYIAYFLFFPYVISSLITHLQQPHRASFYSGLFSIYWVGFLGYLFFPALGPYMMPDLGGPLTEGICLTQWIYELIYKTNNHADVFPSLHCAISAFCLFFDRKFYPTRFWRSLPLCLLIWISTIYLSYHYFIDILVGFALTFFALRLCCASGLGRGGTLSRWRIGDWSRR